MTREEAIKAVGLELVEEAEKNTLWAKTFAFWLEEQGFETAMYYQID